MKSERRYCTRRRKQKRQKNTRYDLSILLKLHILVFAHLARERTLSKNNRHHAKMFRYAFNHSEFIIRRRKGRRKKDSPLKKKGHPSKTAAPRRPRRKHPSSPRPSAERPQQRRAGRPSSSLPVRRRRPRRLLASWPPPPHASLLPRPRPWRGARPLPAGGAR